MHDSDSEDEDVIVVDDENGVAVRNGRLIRQRWNPMRDWLDPYFEMRFRLAKDDVRILARRYGASPFATTFGIEHAVSLSYEERFCCALRYYATGSDMISIGDGQHVHKSTVWRCIEEVSNYLYHNAAQYIIWPETFYQQVNKATRFMQKFGYPRVIGCIDGTHIPIMTPMQNEWQYVNRHHYHSKNVMIVCDADQMIIGLDATFGGAAHDAHVFNHSELRQMGDNGELHNFFLLGDSGYGLHPYLFNCYRAPQNDVERRFNAWQKTTRALIEQTIGVLKSRWRVLSSTSGKINKFPQRCTKVITACAALHNVARIRNTPIIEEPDWQAAQPALPQDDPDDEDQDELPHDPTARDEYAYANFNVPIVNVL